MRRWWLGPSGWGASTQCADPYYLDRMAANLTFDHIGLVVDDLATTAAFFTGLGFTREDIGDVRGTWMDRVVGLDDAVAEIVLISAPDGSGHIELTKFRSPTLPQEPHELPSHAYGLRHVAYRVADVNAVVAQARELGYELVGDVTDFQDMYRLVYIRGPEGLILELTQALQPEPAYG